MGVTHKDLDNKLKNLIGITEKIKKKQTTYEPIMNEINDLEKEIEELNRQLNKTTNDEYVIVSNIKKYSYMFFIFNAVLALIILFKL